MENTSKANTARIMHLLHHEMIPSTTVFIRQKDQSTKRYIKTVKLIIKKKTFTFTLCCTSSGIFNIEDGFP